MKVYLDTSVVIALANRQDEFNDQSVRFVEGLAEREIPSVIGSPLTLELEKAIERRGMEPALAILQTLDEYEIEFVAIDPEPLLQLARKYAAHHIAEKYRIDLLHCASATLLSSTHIASWDSTHFNKRVERKVNRVNRDMGRTSLKVGNPKEMARLLAIGEA